MRAVIYARISPRRMERAANGLRVPASDSIDEQVRHCQLLAERMGLQVEEPPFVDRLVSGRKPRQNFTLALKKAAELQGCLLTMDLSRCYRSLEHMIQTIAFCERHNVSVFTVMGDGFDATGKLSASDRLMAQVLSAVNEYMARQKGERIAAASYAKRHDRACYGGGKLPFGFRAAPPKPGEKDRPLIPVPREIWAVNYLLYCTRRKISRHLACEHLNNAGLLRRGLPWNNKRAWRIIHWYQDRLKENSRLGELVRSALAGCRYVKHPWACVLPDPPRQYRRRIKRKTAP